MKTLVAYYSRTGHTDALAREIAARCGADIGRRARMPQGSMTRSAR